MCSLRQACEADAFLHRPGVAFDYALPQAWWDDFLEKMAVAPTWIVWLYEPNDVWGRPYGVCDAAKSLVSVYLREVERARVPAR